MMAVKHSDRPLEQQIHTSKLVPELLMQKINDYKIYKKYTQLNSGVTGEDRPG